MLAVVNADRLPIMESDHVVLPIAELEGIGMTMSQPCDVPVPDVVSKMIAWRIIAEDAIQRLQHLRDIRAPVVRVEVPVERIKLDGTLLDKHDHARRGILDPSRFIGDVAEQPGGDAGDIVIRRQRDGARCSVVQNRQVFETKLGQARDSFMVCLGRRVLDVREQVGRPEWILRVQPHQWRYGRARSVL